MGAGMSRGDVPRKRPMLLGEWLERHVGLSSSAVCTVEDVAQALELTSGLAALDDETLPMCALDHDAERAVAALRRKKKLPSSARLPVASPEAWAGAQLWGACARGDEDTVAQLLALPGVPLEWHEERRFVRRTPLFVAAMGGHVRIVEALLDAGADANAACGRFGEAPLHVACAGGHDDVVRALAARGSSFSARDLESITPWEVAAPHASTVALLGELGVDLNQTTFTGARLAHICALSASSALPALRAGGADLDALHEKKSTTPLCYAVEHRSVAGVRALIAAGADVHIKSGRPERVTALGQASAIGLLDAIHALLDGGARVDDGNECGTTPLMLASRGGHLACVRALLESGAVVKARNNSGRTAAAEAACFGSVAILQLLAEHGAAFDVSAGAPLHTAASAGHAEATGWLAAHEGVDIEAYNKVGMTPLGFASLRGHVKTVQALLRAGADPCHISKNGSSPLQYGVVAGKEDVVRALMQAGAEAGDTSAALLWDVVRTGHGDMVELIMAVGVDPNVRDGYGRTALALACQQAALGPAEALAWHGARVDVGAPLVEFSRGFHSGAHTDHRTSMWADALTTGSMHAVLFTTTQRNHAYSCTILGLPT